VPTPEIEYNTLTVIKKITNKKIYSITERSPQINKFAY
jgi:hypothetical protein